MKGWRPCGPFVCQTTGRPNRQQLTKRAATKLNRNTSKVPYNGKILTQQRLSRTRFNGRRTSVNRAVIVTDNDGDNKLRVCAHTLLSSESTIENKNPQTDFCLHKRYWEIHITQYNRWLNLLSFFEIQKCYVRKIIMRSGGMTWHGNRGSLIHYSFIFPIFVFFLFVPRRNKTK